MTSHFGSTTKSGMGTQPSLGTITPAIGTRSTMGNQVRSTFKSNPSFGFGTATREMAQRRFISDEHKSKELGTGPTPGPGRYKTFVTTGIQPESKTKTEPNYSFGTAIRFDKVADKRSAAVPGPGAYLI